MAGELVTADFHIEFGGLLLGPGTAYEIGAAGLGGLGVPEPKTSDVELDLDDGAWLGRDYANARLITIPLLITEADAAAAFAAFDALAQVWAPTQVDAELHLRLPGVGHVWCVGRPRGLSDDLSMLHAGIVQGLASFYCGDPTMHRVGAP